MESVTGSAAEGVTAEPAVSALGGAARVVELLERQVAEHSLVPGSKLPTERELAESSGQSRATVRRALGVLEARGWIVRQVGRGTFLAAEARPIAGAGADITSPADIMAARLLIEPPTMPLVVTSATQADFAEMERCLRGGDEAADYAEFEHWDAALHRSFALASHNGLLVRICDLTNDARHQPLWGKLKHNSFTDERREEYARDHRAIVAALRDRDAVAAQEAMRAHLLRVRRYLLGE
ncbi:FadR/GntR family transcriptional regulator [Allonocardiopsis opalescens]|uniref:GntR family transcriptional regulator n=1 Tax=Allonocardiopsis opalescens TaxID=1144618 RepID=A0A2T0QEA5_9ACTN|nr:FCD domain-containing protein [Allonocardiopsis opalescens]PRY02267.1 GntR family transcriptional regulator [Allonocardiopsis opalescens]